MAQDDRFDFIPTPIEQLQRHDFPFYGGPYRTLHHHRCRWCFSICEGWVGFKTAQEAIDISYKPCWECRPDQLVQH